MRLCDLGTVRFDIREKTQRIVREEDITRSDEEECVVVREGKQVPATFKMSALSELDSEELIRRGKGSRLMADPPYSIRGNPGRRDRI